MRQAAVIAMRADAALIVMALRHQAIAKSVKTQGMPVCDAQLAQAQVRPAQCATGAAHVLRVRRSIGVSVKGLQ
jgi:hypothetical protein